MAIEAAFEAERMHRKQQEDQHRILDLELLQARYDARLAERRYAACDPDNRLIELTALDWCPLPVERQSRWNACPSCAVLRGSPGERDERENRESPRSEAGPVAPGHPMVPEAHRQSGFTRSARALAWMHVNGSGAEPLPVQRYKEAVRSFERAAQ
jgi:hypothetical protein